MTKSCLSSLRLLAVALALALGVARTTAAPAAPLSEHAVAKRVAIVLKAVKLNNPSQEAVVSVASADFFQAVNAWHQQVDPELTQLWSDWSAARTPPHQDEAKAAQIAAKIDAVYARFQPRDAAYVHALATVLSPDQIETVKNAMTKVPGFKRTYKAFLQIVPNLTDAQKDYIRQTLLVGRNQAFDTLAKKEKIDLFKKQKVKVQLYIDAQGYNWAKSYKAYVAKLKAEYARKKKH